MRFLEYFRQDGRGRALSRLRAGAFAWGGRAGASLRTGRGWNGHGIGNPLTNGPKLVVVSAALSAPLASLALAGGGWCFYPFIPCHCEERSDVAIRFFCWRFGCSSVFGRPRRAAPTQGLGIAGTNEVVPCGGLAAGWDGARPLHGGGGAVVLGTGRECPGSAKRSGERGKRSWSIRPLPDE